MKVIDLSPHYIIRVYDGNEWSERVKSIDLALPDGMLNITSPLTCRRENFYLTIETLEPADAELDVEFMDKVIGEQVVWAARQYWLDEAFDDVEKTARLEKLSPHAPIHHFNVLSYGFVGRQGQAESVQLMGGAWASIDAEAREDDQHLGYLVLDDTEVAVRLSTLHGISAGHFMRHYDAEELEMKVVEGLAPPPWQCKPKLGKRKLVRQWKT